MKQKTNTAILLAVLAAAPTTMVAAFLYLGAGIGMGSMMIGRRISHRQQTEQRLGRKDLPFAVAMVALDIAAPILMM